MMKSNLIITEANCTIVDSYKITNKQKQIEIVRSLPERFFTKRSVMSYVREWRAHNWLYRRNYQVARTKDTDLNINESLIKRIGYFIINLINFEK